MPGEIELEIGYRLLQAGRLMVHHLLWLTTVAVRGSILFLLFTLSATTASRGEVGCGEIEKDPWLYVSYIARSVCK